MKNRFFKYVSQNILAMIGLSLYILADTYFISKAVGANGITALNMALPVYGVIFALGQMVGVGSAIRYSIVKEQYRNSNKDVSYTHLADDFITKPYSPTVLLLRIQNIFKRMEPKSDRIRYKDLEINIGKGSISNGSKEINLTKNEMIIFSYLLNNREKK